MSNTASVQVSVDSTEQADPSVITFQPAVNQQRYGVRGEVVFEVKFSTDGSIDILRTIHSMGMSADSEARRVAMGN